MISESELTVPVARLIGQSPEGWLSMAAIRQGVRDSVLLSAEDLKPLKNRADKRIDQIVRNIRSHKDVPGNAIFEGYLKPVDRGLAITEKGRKLADCK